MRAGYIQAPLESAGGFVPHHWERLAYLRAGDVILHCVGGVILAVSVVKGVSYQATNHLGQKCRRVDCDYHIFKNSLNLDNYRSVFYTAITRAKKKLKIYWSSETMDKVVKSFQEEERNKPTLSIIKRKLLEHS